MVDLNVAINLRTDSAGTLEKPCSGTFRMRSSMVYRLCWTSLLVRSSITHSILAKPALQGFGSVPGGSD